MKNAWLQKNTRLQRRDFASYLAAAILLTIPLPYIINSIAVIVFAAYIAFTSKKQHAKITFPLLLPALLYVLMAVSYVWTIDPPETVKALSKELPLLVLPLCFFLYKPDAHAKRLVIKTFSYGMAVFGLYYLLRALVRFSGSGNSDVFFYHELVTKDVNAIYMSVLFSVALFWFLSNRLKNIIHYAGLLITLSLIILLSSKNVILINVMIIFSYYLFFAPVPKKIRISSAVLAVAIICGVGYFTRIKDRIAAELNGAAASQEAVEGVNHLTAYQAYTSDGFQPNDYFNGTAFRVYQLRIFKEMLQEDNILFTGYGLNASLNKIKQKGIQYNVYRGDDKQEGYHMLNFHNQYIEIFADTGIIGFILLIFIQIFNLKNALKNKDFTHIAFAILMISLFLTESFLWRQRGVVFFTMLYCLYNTGSFKSYTKSTV